MLLDSDFSSNFSESRNDEKNLAPKLDNCSSPKLHKVFWNDQFNLNTFRVV